MRQCRASAALAQTVRVGRQSAEYWQRPTTQPQIRQLVEGTTGARCTESNSAATVDERVQDRRNLPKHDSAAGIAAAMDLPHEHLWALILAGGDGTRLQALTRRISGAPIPKQYCRILDEESLFEAT